MKFVISYILDPHHRCLQGPLIVAIQELDGTFNHNFKIEENKTKFEITCHSKSRRWDLLEDLMSLNPSNILFMLIVINLCN